MNKIIQFIVVSILLISSNIFAMNAVELSDLTRPSMFIVNYDRIYILEQATVRIYSLKDYSLIKKFGRAGEGPREFKYSADGGRPLSMSFFRDQLIVNSEMKMSFFDKDGTYLREKVFEPGRSLRWNEMILQATDEELSPRHYAAQFIEASS